MPLLDTTCQKIQSTIAGIGCLFCSCWIVKSYRRPNTAGVCQWCFDYSPVTEYSTHPSHVT